MICAYETHGRRCPLHAHRDEYCGYHYERVLKKFRSDEAEYTWFLEWCEWSRRWNLCLWSPVTLWRILCGIVPITAAPRDAWKCPDEDPWKAVIEGRMTFAEYGGKKPTGSRRAEAMPHIGELVAEDQQADNQENQEGAR
jgi:hypothetical protein